MPADAPVVLERGRVSTSVDVTLHATGGLRVDATARFRDVAFTRPGESQPVALAPDATLRLVDVGVHDAGVRLGRLELATSLALFDPRVTPAARFELPGLRVSAANVTWPLAGSARIDVQTGVPGGGHLVAGGTVQAAPAPSDIRLRLSRLDLGPWARYLPPAARITGVAEADLRVNEPLGADIPARIRGSIAVRDLGVANQRQRLVGARRIEATGLEVQWPRRVVVRRVLIDQPSATVERDRAGQLSLPALADGAPSGSAAAPTQPPIAVEVGEIAIRNGAIAWRDQAVKPPAQLDLTRINATVRGASWPLRDPLGIQIALQPPGGGELSVAGRVGVADPPTADVRVVLKGGALAPYQPYVTTPARISGRADLDVALKVPGATEGSVGIRGQAALTQLDVRDQERTVLRVERATATGLDAQWPQRVSIGDLALQQPWILLERDERAALPLRALLEPPSGRPHPDGAAPASANGHPGDPPPAVAVQRLTIEGGGARVVDRSIAPPFAIDLHRLAAKMEGFSTTTGPPARLELTGRAGPDAAIALRGTVGPLGGPLRLDLDGEVREFAIPRTNPYLLRQVAWKAREGRLMTTFRGRIRGDAVEARSDIRVRHLELERAGPNDQAQARIGLPLGLIASLMKNRRGEINVSFPVSGRLDDPRFDFSEAIWKSARTVAINAIATPVSWIGRLQYTADARIEKVQIDPIPFQPGTATITLDGEAQIMRLAGFLEQVPEVRLALTPVVAPRDLAALERQPPSAGDISALAEKRVEAVRDRFKQAKADRARLVENKGPARRDAADGGVQVDLVEQEGPRPPTLGERLRRLGAGILGERPSP
jgi:hypothetical protein